MKFVGVFAAIAVLFVAAEGADFQCPPTTGVSCTINPCQTKKCAKGKIGCANYTSGCNIDCYPCPKTTGPPCFADPCLNNPCPASQSCCPDYANNCAHKCY